MENATRAFYMAAAMLIAVMIMSVMIYVFRSGSRLGSNYEGTLHAHQVAKYNSQFDVYGKITHQINESNYGYSFVEKGNVASDIITCANLAISTNVENDYDDKNSVTIIVDCNNASVPTEYRGEYYIYPMENQPENAFVKNINTLSAAKATTYDESNTLDFYKFLKAFNEIRIVDIKSPGYNSKGETIYKYYFTVDEDENGVAGNGLHYSETTGRIDKVVFVIVPTKPYTEAETAGFWTETR